MAKSEMEVIQLLVKLIGHKTGEISKVDFTPQKMSFPAEPDGETHLPRSTPEEQGVESSFIYELFSNLYEQNNCHMHKVMAVRNGHIIASTAFSPFDLDTWHVTHSMCKSVTGMAIGFLLYEGKLRLDDRISDIFSSMSSPLKSILSNGITVRHLLTMTSGVSFNEMGIVAGNDWRKLFLDAKIKNNPGSVFEYNSMNSYMLSAIVTEITGESMFDYLKPRLFEPLGIKRVFWESCPQNITKGGWGMFLRLEDMAKLGQLYLNKGMYDGKQILPQEWVEEATKGHVETGKTMSPEYGFQLWMDASREGAYTFNGMLGQNVYVYPDINMMIITNAGNEDLFQQGNMSQIVHQHMAKIEVSDTPIPVNSKVLAERNKLSAFINKIQGEAFNTSLIPSGGWNSRKISFTKGRPCKKNVSMPLKKDRMLFGDRYLVSGVNPDFRRKMMRLMDGATYDMDVVGIGIMPLLMQVMHNNYTDGISSIGFEFEGRNDSFYLLIKEGDELHRIRCGFDGKRVITEINEHGENYKVATVSEFSTDEYGRPVLRNEFHFIEDSTSRVMNIYFGKREPLEHGNGIDQINGEPPINIGVRFDEVPGGNMIMDVIDMYGIGLDAKGLNGFVVNQLSSLGAMDVINIAIKGTVRPRLHGVIHVENDETGEEITEGITEEVGIFGNLGYDSNNDVVMEDN